jgi:hypothetical protein
MPVVTSTRVVFSFKGVEKGEYPDQSKFSSDDLRAPDIVTKAIKDLGLPSAENLLTPIRAALAIEGIIPPDVVKQHDRMRAAGQVPPVYIPDEYSVTLTLPRDFPLSNGQRAVLLNNIVSLYRDKFQRTYMEAPLAFGDAFDTLRTADYFDYELVLKREIEDLTAYLVQQRQQAKTFRSPTTNLSFDDLLKQTELFSQIQLNETLGLILQNGLSRNRKTALMKLDYYGKILDDQDRKLTAEEGVIQGLLENSQDRSKSYVLGIKSAANEPRTETPVIDQGLVDSLLANDSYAFLIRRALETGIDEKRVQTEKVELLDRRKTMESFAQGSPTDQASIFAEVDKSLIELETAYRRLTDNVRKTQSDFSRQQFADSIRVSEQIQTKGIAKALTIAASIGGMLGLVFGTGLSLVGFYLGGAGKR